MEPRGHGELGWRTRRGLAGLEGERKGQGETGVGWGSGRDVTAFCGHMTKCEGHMSPQRG